ncbi:MAG: HAD family hydrolase [Anaerolineales bacterium]|nr:HAD family hydrolase [Anaerolineales bacterium]
MPTVNSPLQDIQLILFDLDGTLRHNRPSETHALLDYAAGLGAADAPKNRKATLRWTHYYWAQSPELAEDIDRFPGFSQDFWLNYTVRSLHAFDCPDEMVQELAARVCRYMREEFKSESYVPTEVPKTLQALKDAGFRLGVLSNRSKPYDKEIRDLGLADFFELVLAACEVEAWKPDPLIFLHGLERLGVPANQAVYVGDNYFADVVGAKNAGLRPILLDPEEVFPDVDCVMIQCIADLLKTLPSNEQQR